MEIILRTFIITVMGLSLFPLFVPIHLEGHLSDSHESHLGVREGED